MTNAKKELREWIIALILFGALASIFVAVSNCTTSETKTPPTPTSTPTVQTPVPTPVETQSSRTILSWETRGGKPEWSDLVTEVINENENVFSSAKDITAYCPKYHQLTRELRVKAVAEILVGISKFESNFKPETYYQEPKSGFPKPDAVTGMPVASEGLLQLSYQDQLSSRYAGGCKFDWQKDKALPKESIQKTIQNPLLNLKCGLWIFVSWIKSDGYISNQTGRSAYKGAARYWSTIRDQGHKAEIINRVLNTVRECQ